MKFYYKIKPFTNILIFLIVFYAEIIYSNSISNKDEVIPLPLNIYGENGQNLIINAKFFNFSSAIFSVEWESTNFEAFKENRTEKSTKQQEGIISASLKIFHLRKVDEKVFKCNLYNEKLKLVDYQTFKIKVIDIVYLHYNLWAKNRNDIKIYARIGESIKFIMDQLYFSELSFVPKLKINSIQSNRVNISMKDDIINLTIIDIIKEDSGIYQGIYEVEPESKTYVVFDIFEINVLEKIKLTMDKLYYFQKSSSKSYFIECNIYGYYNELISFEGCPFIITNETENNCNFEKLSNNYIKIRKPSYEKGPFQYIIKYPYANSGTIRCFADINNTKESVTESMIAIGSYPDIVSIIGIIDGRFKTLQFDEFKNAVIEATLGKVLHLECITLDWIFSDVYWTFANDSKIDRASEKYAYITGKRNDSDVIYQFSTLEITRYFGEITNFYTCKVFFNSNNNTQLIRGVSVTYKANKEKKQSFGLWIVIGIMTFMMVSVIILIVTCQIKNKMTKSNGNENQLRINANNRLSAKYSSLCDLLKDLNYDENFEFPEEQLKLGKLIGLGNFGIVYQGLAMGLGEKILSNEEETIVAVKTVKSLKNRDSMACLISEMKILIHLGKHLNIVNLLGAITNNLHKGKLMVIVEYCPYGNLEILLQNNRNNFLNQINAITNEIDSVSDFHNNSKNILNASSNIELSFNSDQNHEILNSDFPLKRNEILTTTDLICWACQIACGMDYISNRNIMHGDLAVRNVLLTFNNVVKICDFGLAKTVSNISGNYIKKGALLPLKWLAIECLQDHEFTIKSDVWSFGILLWELFSLGCSPYPNIKAVDLNFLEMLQNGYRMEKPEYANNSLYEIMLKCWNANPVERPTFCDLENFLNEFLPNDIYMNYVRMNEPYMQMNAQLANRKENEGSYMKMSNLSKDLKHKYFNNPAIYENDKVFFIEQE